ncbi:MAG TPA: 2OG-Fe(II) oxygenase [Polyangia bacterium]|nr:2OG-Fe(II) oxygenase [Polyangia bacterium]
MGSTILEEVSAAIGAVGGKSAFAVEERASADDLELRVRGVGRVRLPVNDSVAEKLIAAARPAPFGVRDETRYDERVRSTWEIAADRITVGGGFERLLAGKLDTMRRRLGLPRDGVSRLILDKLLVYGPGQFFAPHQDSERAEGMLATLVAVLPSRHTGGAIVVRHGGQRRVLAADGGEPDDVDLVAFYADCRHEVEPVKSGYRVALTYHLVDDGTDKAWAAVGRTSAVDRLAESVRAHLATPARRPYRKEDAEPPDRLVYLLDHEYTQRGLAFARLKGEDRPRVSALLQVAERLDCEAYLALAEIHETWNCEEDEWGGYHRYERHRRLEARARNRNPEEYDLLDLCVSEVTLGHWVGRDGAADPGVPAYAGDDEICSTRPSVEMKPFRSEHEGYMGNYGNTVDRWYHRAALVLWPRSRAFVVRAKASPAWAAGEIMRLLATGNHAEAEKNARSLLPFWRHARAAVKTPSFPPKVFRIAAALGDADLARALLIPLGAPSITAASVRPLLVVAERFGLAWSRELFASWADERGARSSCLVALPVLCRALAASAWPDARPLGVALLDEETAAYRDRCIADRSVLATRHGADARAALVRDAMTLIEALAALENQQGRERFLGALTGPEAALPAAMLVEVLEGCRRHRVPREVRSLGLAPLHEHATQSLRASLERPVRAADDWSLAPPLDCTCALCARLLTFLRDRNARDRAWPLAKEGRQHIHGIIERFDLPVAHDTVRKGSPFTLMLEKQAILFSGEAAERKREASLLAALERWRPSYIDAAGKISPPPRRSRKKKGKQDEVGDAPDDARRIGARPIGPIGA